MSADNEIGLLNVVDGHGNNSYRVADNVSMSYNILGLELDLTDKEQVEVIYNIWKDAKEFYHHADAYEYCRQLEENNYYEYGMGIFTLNMDWDEFILLAKSMGVC